MAEQPHHPTDALQDAVDGRLTGAERVALDAHLAACPECRREFEALSWVKRQLADARGAVPVPQELDADIRRALDAADAGAMARHPAETAPRARTRRWTWVGWVAAAAALAALVWVGTRSSTPSLPALVAAEFRTYASGGLALDLETADPAILDARLQAAALPFPTRVFDFGMMNIRLVGGGVHRIAGRPGALFAYEGPGGLRVLCQMYEGSVIALPAPTERLVNDGIEFLTYRDEDVTIVFWQEGTVVCVLAANGPADAVVKLAFAKARRV